MGFEEVHYFVNYVVMMKTVNREAAQFSENKSKRALKKLGLANARFLFTGASPINPALLHSYYLVLTSIAALCDHYGTSISA
jgi:long-subunit acyl-CoA synthetase (AMP-forming)